MAIPICLSPNSCVISDRSSPSPAPAVPPATFAINSSRNGRRSVPRNAIAVSLANPIRSALGGSAVPIRSWKSGGIRRRSCSRRGKLRRDIAMKDGRADMIEAALQIGPDFAADIGPSPAEGKILAEISSGLRIDHALEQCEPVGTSRQRVEGMFAEELQRGVGRMLAHPFEDVTPDHQETGAGKAHARKSIDGDDMIRIVDLQHVVESGRRQLRPV